MNNQNDSNSNDSNSNDSISNDSDQNPRPRSERDWAEVVEQQGQPLQPDSQSQSSALDDLDSQQLEDLQLDGQLRMLRRLSATDDSFVENVIAQTENVSQQDSKTKPRLPILAPVFESEAFEPPASKTSHLNPSVDLSTTAEQPDQPQLSPAQLPIDSVASFQLNKAIAIIASVAAAITVGFLIWGATGPDSPHQTSNPQPDQNFANNRAANSPQAPTDPANQSIDLTQQPNQDLVVRPNPDMNLVPQPGTEKDHAPLESFVKNPAEQPPVQIDNQPKPQLVNKPARDGVEDVYAEPAPRLQWRLAIDFDRHGLGTITLNDESIFVAMLVDNADFVLRQLGDEFSRRVRFLESRLGTEMSGSIKIGSSQYPFKSIDEIEPAIELACKHFATLDSSNLSIGEFVDLRKNIRELMDANPSAISSIDLENQQIAFSTEDEVFTICSILTASEAVLKDTARQRLAWEKRQNFESPKLNQTERSITPEAFANFAAHGQLILTTPENKAARLSTIQSLGEQELKKVLYTTIGSFDLFKNNREFVRAERYISTQAKHFQEQVTKKLKTITKAPPADLPKLTDTILAQLDRTDLESKKFIMSKDINAQRLPLAMGDECRSSRNDAVAIDWVSSTLGTAVNQFDPSLGSRDASNNDAFRIRELKKQLKTAIDASLNPQHLKTANQILQIDHPRMRLELIEALEESNSDTGLKLLAQRAKFDLVPEVRLAATNALSNFPRDQFRDELLAGLKYPWHVVAQHSAEALVRLDDQEAIPELVDMLDLLHPNAPVEVEKNKFVQPELVAINHMRNCLLCHAPAGSSHDIASGVVPRWGMRLPKQYYKSENSNATSVRADVTYLEQDFSVVQPVANHGLWPRDQRFDYVVQQRPLKRAKVNQINRLLAQTPNLNREAIVFALQKLTNETPADNSSESWRAILRRRNAMPAL